MGCLLVGAGASRWPSSELAVEDSYQLLKTSSCFLSAEPSCKIVMRSEDEFKGEWWERRSRILNLTGACSRAARFSSTLDCAMVLTVTTASVAVGTLGASCCSWAVLSLRRANFRCAKTAASSGSLRCLAWNLFLLSALLLKPVVWRGSNGVL
jgi:hypothetical protein